MLEIFRKFREEAQTRGVLRSFWLEMEQNLELYYVMDQRQFITESFKLDAYALVKERDLVKSLGSIATYARAMDAFNRSYQEYKEYEAWYSSDINRKTPDNARKLHQLKNDLDEKLKGLDAVIIPAGQALEKEMVRLGLLKL